MNFKTLTAVSVLFLSIASSSFAETRIASDGVAYLPKTIELLKEGSLVTYQLNIRSRRNDGGVFFNSYNENYFSVDSSRCDPYVGDLNSDFSLSALIEHRGEDTGKEDEHFNAILKPLDPNFEGKLVTITYSKGAHVYGTCGAKDPLTLLSLEIQSDKPMKINLK